MNKENTTAQKTPDAFIETTRGRLQTIHGVWCDENQKPIWTLAHSPKGRVEKVGGMIYQCEVAQLTASQEDGTVMANEVVVIDGELKRYTCKKFANAAIQPSKP